MCNASSPIDQADIEQIEQRVNDSFQEIIENYQVTILTTSNISNTIKSFDII